MKIMIPVKFYDEFKDILYIYRNQKTQQKLWKYLNSQDTKILKQYSLKIKVLNQLKK